MCTYLILIKRDLELCVHLILIKRDIELCVTRQDYIHVFAYAVTNTAEVQWLEHLWNHENMFEAGVVRANECLS